MNGVRRRFFISYAHGSLEDERLCARFAEALAAEGHQVFVDKDIKFGSDWADEIQRQLNECDSFLVLLSENALASEMVLQEVERTRNRREADGVPRIFTVRVRLEGKLPYRWGAYLDKYQSRTWRQDADFRSILGDILASAEDSRPPTPGPSSVTPMKMEHPEPRVEFTAPGGAMGPQDRFYVSREADKLILEQGETVLIKGPRQIGKSSLLKRYLLRSKLTGKRPALIDLSIFSSRDLAEYPTFLTSLAQDMQRKLDLPVDRQLQIRTNHDLADFVQHKLLSVIPEPIVLAFDEVDRVLGQPYQTDFFSMLRYWHERRTDPGQERTGWPRLELALVISTEPYLLIDDAMHSPFTVREPIKLDCFTKTECEDLNNRYNRLLSEVQVSKLHDLLGGQPYLTRLAYFHLGRKGGRNFSDLERSANEGGDPFRDHLGSLLRKLRKKREQNLLAAMKQVITHGSAPAVASERLECVGLIRKTATGVAPANHLYQRFFEAAS